MTRLAREISQTRQQMEYDLQQIRHSRIVASELNRERDSTYNVPRPRFSIGDATNRNQSIVVIPQQSSSLSDFDGTSDFYWWKQEAETFLEDFHGSERSKINRLLKALKGNAKVEILSTPDASDYLSNLFDILELAFGDRSSSVDIQTQFFTRRQNFQEDIQTFAIELKKPFYFFVSIISTSL